MSNIDRAIVHSEIVELISSVLLVDREHVERVDPQAEDFLTGLGANSIDALEVIVAVEDRYGISFDDSEMNLSLVRTLSTFVDRVVEKRHAQAGT
jgi:acyl carrier protein